MPSQIHSALCNLITQSMERGASIESASYQSALSSAIECVADELGENTDGTTKSAPSDLQASADALEQAADFVVADAKALYAAALREENNFASLLALAIIDDSKLLQKKIHQFSVAAE